MRRVFVEYAPLHVMLLMALSAGGMFGCGDDAQAPPVRDDAADAGAVVDDPYNGFDANLPHEYVAVVSDAGPDQAPPDADPYVLEEESITTCGQFFECLNDCPPEYDSCVGPCHDAMTTAAAALVRRFVSCINRNACSSQDCILRECGGSMQACFEQPG